MLELGEKQIPSHGWERAPLREERSPDLTQQQPTAAFEMEAHRPRCRNADRRTRVSALPEPSSALFVTVRRVGRFVRVAEVVRAPELLNAL